MILSTEETWATDTLRDAQDPGAGTALWKPLSKLTLERYNLIFSQAHSRGYAADGQPEHDCGTVLENSANTLFKVALVGGDLLLTKWSVGNDPEAAIDDAVVVADANLSDTARPSLELVAGVATTVRIFYIDEDDDEICYIESADSGDTFGAEVSVGALSDAKAIASVSTTKVHCITYASGNTRFHCYEDDGGWAVTDSLLYWPHEVDHIDAITVGNRDLIVFYSLGPMHEIYREAGIYGVWYKHGRWSDLFPIDVVGEATAYSYRQHPMISTANDIYFLTLVASEGDSQYSQALRALKTSKDGRYWSQYQPLVTCTEAGPAKLLAVDAETDATWPWSAGLQTYIVGYDKVYESDSTRLIGEENSDLQVDVTSRTTEWRQSRGVIAQATSLLANHDGALDAHATINADNTLLAVREAGYYTGVGAEYAELSLEQVDFLKESDELPRRHKQMASRDLMAWMRDKQARHYEEWASQVIGYDNYDNSGITGRGGLSHTIAKTGRWEAEGNQLWLKSDNQEGIAFASWASHVMNGQVKDMVRIETEGNDEYAGVIFRALDEGNFWSAYYDQDTDKIVLRQKVGGAWLVAVATSAALGWADDTWYGILVDFRYSYIRVYSSTDGLTWTLRITHVIVQNPSLPAPEYGYTGAIGYGYSDQDTDHPAGYVVPTLPPPLVPPGPSVEGGGNLLYMMGLTRMFRTLNALESDPTAVVLEDLGQIAGGATMWWFALDSFNPAKRAMAVGEDGVYTTTDLDAAAPTWTQALDLSGVAAQQWWAHHVVSSICQQNLWMVTVLDYRAAPGVRALNLYYTADFGGAWNNLLLSNAASYNKAYVEASSHDAQDAWAYYMKGTDAYGYSVKTSDQWASSGETKLSLLDTYNVPCGYHRYLNNLNDYVAVHTNHDSVQICTNDAASCTASAIATGLPTNIHERIGGYTWGSGGFWVLSMSGANTPARLFVSEDGINWTLQYSWAGAAIASSISGFPTNPDLYYASMRSVTTGPFQISLDRGVTWQTQTGNWALLATEGIRHLVPVWTE